MGEEQYAAQETQHWELTRGVCETDGAEGATVYGVRVTVGEREWAFADVDVSPYRVEVLLGRLRQAQPAFCHMEDIVRDFIEGGAE